MQNSALFKWIGIVAMTIDHVGVIFFPQMMIFRVIGRLALPMFVGALVSGYEHTSNIKRYFSRLLIFGVISQVPFQLLFDEFRLNIILSLALSLATILLIDKKRYVLVAIVLLASIFLPFEYGWYAPVTAAIIFLMKENRSYAVGLLFFVTIIYTAQVGSLVQLLSIVGYALVIYLPKIDLKLAINKYFFYFYYPAHLFILYILERIVG